MKYVVGLLAFFTLLGTTVGLAQEHEPTVSLYSMLRNIPESKGGQPVWGGSSADIVFAPPGDFKCKVLVKSRDQVLAEFPATVAQRLGPIARVRWKHQFTKLPLTPGPCSVEVYVDDKLAGRLPFELLQSDTGFEFSGPWSTHAQFYYPSDNSKQQRVHFVYWAKRGDLGGPTQGMVDLVMSQGDKVVATARARDVSYDTYIKYDQELRKPDGQPLMAPDLAALSGPFRLNLRHDGRVIRSFSGAIEGGQFVPHPRSALSVSDPTEFLATTELSEDGGFKSPFVFTWVTTP